MRPLPKSAVTPLLFLMLTGCAARNYNFEVAPQGPSRISQLVGDLDRLGSAPDEADDELYDVSLAPLLHSRLHVFARVEEEDTPAAFIEFDFESSFPLFGFVNGSVSRYDDEQHLLIRNDFNSAAWGAFRKERELVATSAGHREKTRHTFLWLFSWWGKETWPITAEVASPAHQNPARITLRPRAAAGGI